jgi:hypothetical protein
MREAVKVLCVVVFLFAVPTAVIVWTDDRPSFTVSVLKYACPVLSVLAIVIFLKLHFRRDEAHDYLREHVGAYFNRGGFCFGFRPTAVDGVCWLEAYFQNQHERPCIGRIAIRPARGFFLGRAKIDTIAVEINCEPAAFGVARIAVPIPANLQGKRQSFEVGASVDYPQGKGRRLRFRDGIVLRANANFGNAFGTALTVAGALTGQIVISTPATTTLELPAAVAEDVPDGLGPKISTLWKLGDPPLRDVAEPSVGPEPRSGLA